MFLRIENTPRDYAWGSHGEISALLGQPPSGALEAELWLGAHPGSPSRLVEKEGTLADTLPGRLPFLLKVLAAASPLSLQAHPTLEQSVEGFERENALAIPLDAPHRNYRDAFPKPELIYAVSERFDALCGFRDPADVRTTVETLLRLATTDEAAVLEQFSTRVHSELRDAFSWLVTRGDGVDELVTAVVAMAERAPDQYSTVLDLARAYPGDPGIVSSLLINRVTLRRGEALYLPAGNIHAYLAGVGIELMTASDNVLRGGLTPKHVDVDELLAVLDFAPAPVPYLEPTPIAEHVIAFRPPVRDFQLLVVDGPARIELPGDAIALATAGSFELAGLISAVQLDRGQATFASADEGALTIHGEGQLFVATTQ